MKLNTTNAVTDMDELKKLEIDYLVSINAYFLPGDNIDLNNFCTGTTNSTTGSTTSSTQSLSNDFFSSETDNISDQHPIFRRRTLFNPFVHLFPDEIHPPVTSSIIHLDQPIRAMFSNGFPVHQQAEITFLDPITQADDFFDGRESNEDDDDLNEEEEEEEEEKQAQVMRYLTMFREDNEESFDDRHYNFDKEELLAMNT